MTTLDVYDEGVYQEAFRLADAVHRFLNRRSTQQVLALLDDDVVRPLIESNDRMYLLRTARISAARAEQQPAQSDEQTPREDA